MLDRVTIWHDDRAAVLSGQPRHLLAALVAAGPQGASVDVLADELWGDRLPPTWQNALRNVVTTVRRKLGGAAALPTAQLGYRLGLPEDQVDLWELHRRAAAPLESWSAEHARLLEFHTAFPDIGYGAMVGTAIDGARRIRRRVLLQLLTDGPRPDQRVLDAARACAEQDLLDDELASVVAAAHGRAGHWGRAVGLLDLAMAHIEVELGGLPKHLRAQRERMAAELIRERSCAHRALPASTAVPTALARLASTELIGPATELATQIIARLDALRGHDVVLVEGASGAGKSSVLASVARSGGFAGWTVLYAAGDPDRSAAFGPFIGALPQLRRDIARLAVSAPQKIFRDMVWSLALQHLTGVQAERGLILLIDDVHELDDASEKLLDLCLRATTDRPVQFVLSASTSTVRPEWRRLRQRLVAATGTTCLTVRPLDHEHIHELVRRRHPQVSSHLLVHAAAEVHELSRGIAGVAHLLIANLDPETLALARVPDSPGLATLLAAKADTVQRLGQAAAVLARPATLDVLASLAELDIEAAWDAATELIAGELLVEAPSGLFAVAHALVGSAFLAGAPPARQRRLHRTAAALATGVHERARHQEAAVPLVPAEVAAADLIDSAEDLLRTGAAREAVDRYRRAASLSHNRLAPRAGASYAIALERSGSAAAAQRVRSAPFAEALDGGDHSAALAAAIAGLPEGESPEGDAERVRQLASAAPTSLSRAERLLHASQSSRQSALVGRYDAARRWADQLVVLARSPEDHAAGLFARWFAYAPTADPRSWLLELERAAKAELTGPWPARLAHLAVIEALRCGDAPAARRWHGELAARAAGGAEPMRRWYDTVVELTMAQVDARFDDAALAATKAASVGYLYGITATTLESSLFRFVPAWATGRHGELVAALESAPAELRRTGPNQVALAACLHAAQRTDEALRLASEFVAPDSRSQMRNAEFCCLLAPLAGDSGDTELRHYVSERLSGLTGTNVVLGGAVAHLGPVDRYIGLAARDEDALRRAVALADRFETRLWQVSCRLDLHRLTGDPTARAEAFQLAGDTALAFTLA